MHCILASILPTFFSCRFRMSRAALRISGVVLLFVMTHHTAHAFVVTAPRKDKPCVVTHLNFEGGTDLEALDKQEDAVAALLKQENFKELDCLADAARSGKTKFPGGMWILHNLYAGLDQPTRQHATEVDWRNHLARLERWVAARPNSITARVALAQSYAGYGWVARGEESSDTVSDSGWKLFRARHAKAKAILDQAARLRNKCPEWYVAMQQVALALGWEPEQAADLLRQAIAFEPGYYYYYRMQANYLLPKWFGQKGDTEQFAAESADRIGGDAGDILYFQIASELVCTCDDPQFRHMSWPRVQKGYAALEKQSGHSFLNLNLLALMAVKAEDAEVADSTFKQIGDNWYENTWRKESYFDRSKKWASELAPSAARLRTFRQEAETNMATAEGVQYKRDFEQRLAEPIRHCVQSAGNDRRKFDLLLQVMKDGNLRDVEMPTQTAVVGCLFQELMKFQQPDAVRFPPPPHAPYWVILEIDPATFDVAAK
jgi:hypothetical protein